MNLRYDTLNLAHLKSKITGHPLCYMFEETEYVFTVIFHEAKNGVCGLKVSRGLGDGKALEKLFEKLNWYEAKGVKH